MKSCEEMTKSVLNRARQEKQAQQRRTTIFTMTVACACCFSLALMAIARTPKETPQDPIQIQHAEPKARIMLLNNGAADTQPEELIQDVTMPYQIMIRVRDVTGCSQTEREAVMEEERRYADELRAQSGFDSANTRIGGDKAVISVLSVGWLFLTVDDFTLIEDYSVETTETGYINSYAHVYKDVPGIKHGIGFGWTLSNEALAMIEENPGIKLSALSDTITITVKFTDGAQEQVVVDMQVHDDGQVYAVHRGVTVAV